MSLHVRAEGREWRFGEEEQPTFGRHRANEIALFAAADDTAISRRGGRFEFFRGSWHVRNTGSRSFFVVEPSAEVEVFPPTLGRDLIEIGQLDAWVRLPGERDHALEVFVEGADEAEPSFDSHSLDSAQTEIEVPVRLTTTERRSVLAVYEHYLRLPPMYRREPRSFRAAAALLHVEEGKVKADLRRVQAKVAAAGGPSGGGSRYRDVLISWLHSRQVVRRADLEARP